VRPRLGRSGGIGIDDAINETTRDYTRINGPTSSTLAGSRNGDGGHPPQRDSSAQGMKGLARNSQGRSLHLGVPHLSRET
jgi:hypothetical protein